MTSLFDSYEQEFSTLASEIQRAISQKIPAATGEARQRLVRDAEKDLDDGQDILEQMELELRSMGGSGTSKETLRQRVASYRKQLERLERDLRKAAIALDGGDAAREELLSGHLDDLTTSNDQARGVIAAACSFVLLTRAPPSVGAAPGLALQHRAAGQDRCAPR